MLLMMMIIFLKSIPGQAGFPKENTWDCWIGDFFTGQMPFLPTNKRYQSINNILTFLQVLNTLHYAQHSTDMLQFYAVASPGFCVRGGHRYPRQHCILLSMRYYIRPVCHSHTIFKMKIHDSLKNYRYRVLTKSSADADKPARRVWRPVKVAKHGTFYILGIWFPTCVLQ